MFSPTNWLSANIDYWQVRRSDRIYELTAQQVVANYTTFPENLVRGANGRLDGLGGYIRAGFVNAEGDVTEGVDVGVATNWKALQGKWTAEINGTYIDSFRSRVFATQKYTETAGQYNARDLFVRWKHTLKMSYETGPWTGSLSQYFTSGYKDEKPLGVIPPGFDPNVENYIRYDVSGTYKGFKNLTVRLGIKNLLNTDPPFTAHNVDFSPGAGWDARVADPRGRAYTASVTYKF